jgi:histidine triad (HIT) family protein
MDDCLFCKIARGDIPSDKVLEDDTFVAFRDINPKAPQHVLVVPREHIVSLNDVDRHWKNCEGQSLLEFMVRVAALLGISKSGYRALVNVGPDGGQEVQHLHFHILGGEDLGDFR